MKASTSRWFAVRNGRGDLKGWIEMFWSPSLDSFVTMPGLSGWRDAR